MSDRMDKDAMDKFFNYMKSAYPYPPSTFPVRNSYYQHPQDYPKEDKDKKPTAQSYQQMYGYPPYNPYQMPPMGYPQHYSPPSNDQEPKNDEDKAKHEVPNPYAPYYPYNYGYPYYYPPYYYGRDGYPSKTAPHSFTSQIGPQPPGFPPMEHPQLKILSKPQEKPVKQQIVISSDQQDVVQAAPLPQIPASTIAAKPAIQVPMVEEKPAFDKKQVAFECVNIEQNERDPFYIHKKQKIHKEEKELPTKTRITRTLKQLAAVEKEKQLINRYTGMPSQTYQEMMKKQTRMRLELFYQRERLRREQEKAKQAKDKEAKEKEKDIQKQTKIDKSEKADTEKKANSDDKSEKDKKEVKAAFQGTSRISGPSSLPQTEQKKEDPKQRERIKDDHPLKELRYNQSHGRIRLGGYFQSTIPNLMRHKDLAVRRVQLQKRLKEREVSAITF